ncbi:MAG: M23 family metallopeptidase, partial [Actinomycetota bacterium]
FADAIRAADEVFAGIGDEPDELRNLFAANDRFAREGIGLLARRSDELRKGIDALADFVEFQLEERDQVEASLVYLPQFLHAIEDSSIPWRTPDGREFYRLRVAQVLDNVPSTWPCKYVVPEGYERLPHVRDARNPVTSADCLDEDAEAEANRLAESLVASLEAWAAENPDALAPEEPLELAYEVPAGPAGEEQAGLIWPVTGPITSYFGPRDGDMHKGIDIGADSGDPVVAADDGTVVSAGYSDDFGTTVIVDHGGGMQTLYAHLAYQTVTEGQELDRGDPLGVVGCTGDCSGSHLHFEIHVDGVPVDPLDYLPGGPLYRGGD